MLTRTLAVPAVTVRRPVCGQRARGAGSVSQVAVELVEKIFGDLRGRAVLLVGAGNNGWLRTGCTAGWACMVSSAYGQPIMPFLQGSMNDWAIDRDAAMVQTRYNYTPHVAWVPERVFLDPSAYPNNGVIDWMLAPLGLKGPGLSLAAVVFSLAYLWLPYMVLPVEAALSCERSWVTMSVIEPTAEYITCTLPSASVAASI